LLVPALRKEAKHDRIVFIDINVPPSESSIPETEWFNKLTFQIKRLEENPPPGKDLPSAFVFLTNFPYHFVEKDDPLRGSAVVFTGLNMPEFRLDYGDPSLLPGKYPAIMALHTSLLRHTQVPHDL
jgi:hypothetical protein